MKAAIFKGPGVFQVEDVPDPEVGPRDVLVRISHCAICGSDLHRYSYGMLKPGAIIGHEYSGKVVAVGKEVRAYRIGDRVMRGKDYSPAPARFSAKEKGFLPFERDRAYAEYLAVNAEGVMKVPESVTNLEACLGEPLSVAVHAVRASRIRLGDRVLVLGAGPVGLLIQQCAALSGASEVYVSEINPARRAAASGLGASMVLDPTSKNLVEEIVRRTGIGVDLAFECAGADPTLQQSLEAVRASGRVIVVSLAWEPVRCLPVEWVGREVEMKAVYGALAEEWPIASGLLQSGKINVKPLISEIVSLDEIQKVFQELLRPNTRWVQVVVAFE